MNTLHFGLTHLPQRSKSPRSEGLTMVMDKGLSISDARGLVETAGQYIDFIKIGFGSAAITPNLKEKLNIYRQANIRFYFGGTLFEAFVVRDMLSQYEALLEEFEVKVMEISDGCIQIEHSLKCEYIRHFAQRYTVLSEVGSKDKEVILPPYKWVEMIEAELAAGAWKIIAESREGGTIGIYRSTGEVRMGLIDEILNKIAAEQIIWEAPQKVQQEWFIKKLGANVNLGNIPSNEVIALETLRIGLRGDTFFQYLPR